MSLNGRATELVKAAGQHRGKWCPPTTTVADRAAQGPALANGDDDGEYWRVTTIDGTQYFFGREHGAGWSIGHGRRPIAVWTRRSTATTQASPATPPELRRLAPDAGLAVEPRLRRRPARQHHDVLLRAGDRRVRPRGRPRPSAPPTTAAATCHASSTATAATAAESRPTPRPRSLFDVADRCDAGPAATPTTSRSQASWPDTPWDQYCTRAPCTDQLAPTFWTRSGCPRSAARCTPARRRLRRCRVVDVAARPISRPAPTRASRCGCAGITRTGKVTSAGGPAVTDPEVSVRPRRRRAGEPGGRAADGTSSCSGTASPRSPPRPARRSGSPTPPRVHPLVAADAAQQHQALLPAVLRAGRGRPEAGLVPQVRGRRVSTSTTTPAASSTSRPTTTTSTQPAWHYDDSELVKPKKRTWGQFRGYGRVRVRTGSGIRRPVRAPNTSTSAAWTATSSRPVPGLRRSPTPRAPRWRTTRPRGGLREETVLDGAGGTWLSGTISTPVRQGPTATSGPLKAWMSNTGTVRKRLRLSTGATRWTKTVTTFNSDNLPTQIDDFGDEVPEADDRCSRIWYARNPDNWMLDAVKRTEAVGVSCATPAVLPGDMLSSARTSYDSQSNNWDSTYRSRATWRRSRRSTPGPAAPRYGFPHPARHMTGTAALPKPTTPSTARRLRPTRRTPSDRSLRPSRPTRWDTRSPRPWRRRGAFRSKGRRQRRYHGDDPRRGWPAAQGVAARPRQEHNPARRISSSRTWYVTPPRAR